MTKCVHVPIPPGLVRLIQKYIDLLSVDAYRSACQSMKSMNYDDMARDMIKNFEETAAKCGIKNQCPSREEIETCAAQQSGGLGYFGISGETAKKIMTEGALTFFEIYCKNGVPEQKNLVAWLKTISDFVCTYKSPECLISEGVSSSSSLLDFWWVFALLSLLGILVAFVFTR
jgi:hypothetical protein